MLFHQKRHETVKNITWSELNHPSLSEQSTGCSRQDLGREHSLLSVIHMLCVSQLSQVCHVVSRCVKDGSCSSSSLEWKLMDCTNGISYKCQTLSNTSQMTLFFFFQEDSALVHMHCACNTVQLLRRSRLPFSWTTPPTAPSWAAAWVWVVSHKDWRNQAATGWIVAMHWYSIWVKKCDFRVSPFCQVV